MADEVELKYRIPLFDGTNFGNWKFRMETLLLELDLLNLAKEPYVEMVKFEEADEAVTKQLKQK